MVRGLHYSHGVRQSVFLMFNDSARYPDLKVGLAKGCMEEKSCWLALFVQGVGNSVIAADTGGSGFVQLVDGRDAHWVAEMRSAVFCLAPTGGGWGIRCDKSHCALLVVPALDRQSWWCICTWDDGGDGGRARAQTVRGSVSWLHSGDRARPRLPAIPCTPTICRVLGAWRVA
jgi:hypothetical protein